jgi:Fe-S-cluster containining protein
VKRSTVSIDRLETWSRYRSALCASCVANCCRLPVEVRIDDLVRMGLIDAFDADEAPKTIAKRLQKAGVVAHFNFKSGIFTLAQRSNGDCLYLDATTRRCTIYERRPDTCRNHPQIGPRPGYCAYAEKNPGA